jgi:hypothetical protein
VEWHIGFSQDVVSEFEAPLDVVFIDGDHSEEGCERDWLDWSPLVGIGGTVVLHDARLARPGGRGLPGPTGVVDRYLRGAISTPFEIVEEADRTVAALRVA